MPRLAKLTTLIWFRLAFSALTTFQTIAVDSLLTSASEMTYIVSGGALNSTNSTQLDDLMLTSKCFVTLIPRYY